MTEVFLGQVMPVGFDFAPKNFALCNGQLLPINQNQALFSLLGTQYGGDGRVTFALPDLQGRTPVGAGASADPSWNPPPYTIGATGGSESVTLLGQQMPAHSHLFQGSTAAGTTRRPTDNLYGGSTTPIYANSGGPQVALDPSTLSSAGGTQPHENRQPYRCISFCIALQGIFPSRN
ncbi:phage tail protein [Vulcaniibacterium tengchongense]|uniref:Microcystin-dependent protein n=1 Tax=Vulcaniibacterium tengchongense TaxID=1273429 RepID=A0A3N4VS36_9GAMM|nr:tail fiber protein [Vulcaniibacterium tengchongense]RPE82021.1 microcystin-dependent protein [Vulcaniibacterium tengchongense]